MEQSPSWEAGSHSASQEILLLLWNPKVHYCVHWSLLNINRLIFVTGMRCVFWEVGTEIANSMEQSPSWEADSYPANLEIPLLLWTPKVHYRLYKIPPIPRPCVTLRYPLAQPPVWRTEQNYTRGRKQHSVTLPCCVSGFPFRFRVKQFQFKRPPLLMLWTKFWILSENIISCHPLKIGAYIICGLLLLELQKPKQEPVFSPKLLVNLSPKMTSMLPRFKIRTACGDEICLSLVNMILFLIHWRFCLWGRIW
jgi:hypothetical protein